jgi:hypothetical protein
MYMSMTCNLVALVMIFSELLFYDVRALFRDHLPIIETEMIFL